MACLNSTNMLVCCTIDIQHVRYCLFGNIGNVGYNDCSLILTVGVWNCQLYSLMKTFADLNV